MANKATLSRISLVLALLFPGIAAAATYYVATNGNDNNSGTRTNAPLATITNAYSLAGPGDVIYLRGGTYRQQVTLPATVAGSPGSPITLTAYTNETPVISGLDVLSLTWTATNNPLATNNPTNVWVASYTAPTNSYTTNLPTSILQLFYKGKPMLNARWPRCPTNADGSWNFFATNAWAYSDTNASYGTMADSDLANLSSNAVNGAMAVLNVGHQYYTWTRVATYTTPTTFTYATNGIQNSQSFADDCFYLFGKREFLDSPGEWYYDATNSLLYFITPDGASPTNGLVEVKTRPWSFMATSSANDYLTIQGITFLGTAFQFGGGGGNKSIGIVFSSNTVNYSSWTEYLKPLTNTPGYGQDTIFPTMWVDGSSVSGNTFTNGSLNGLLILGITNSIENNTFSDFDLSSSLYYPPLQVNLPYTYYTTNAGGSPGAGGAVVRYNTLQRSGGIQLQVAQQTNDVYLNQVSDSFLACYGGNIDVAAIYFQNYFISGTRVHHNWVQGGYAGTPPQGWGGGLGIRGDDSTCGATVDHNVTWNLGGGGIQLKNTNTVTNPNQCINNSVFNDSAYNGGTNSAIIISTTQYVGQNSNAIVANNLAVSIDGNWFATPLGPVALLDSNVTLANPGGLLVNAPTNTNAAWLDFRPASNSTTLINQASTNSLIITNLPGITTCTTWPILNTGTNGATDVGAYRRSDPVYFIPGVRSSQASAPIVPSGSIGISKTRDALMWRPAYGAATHTVYFGTNTNAWTTNQSFAGESNVFTLPTNLASGTMYYWRVDAVMTNGTTTTNTGSIWSFSTTPAFSFPAAQLTNNFYTGSGMAATLNNVGTVPVIITYNGSTNLPVNAGSYTVIATVADTNNYSYLSKTNTFTINKTTPVFTFASNSLSQAYTGGGISVSLTNASNAPVSITYNGSNIPPTNAGSYTVVATVTDTNNYNAYSVTNTLTISKATPVFTFASNSLSGVYTGSNVAVSLTNAGSVPVSITYNGSTNAPTNAGSYTVVATAMDTNNYAAYSVTNTLTIAQALATVSFGSTNATYDGSAKSVTVATTPSGLSNSVTYNGSTNAPTNAGSYPVVCVASNANYLGSNSTTLVIAKASNSITFPQPATLIYTATITNSSTTLGATASSGLSVSYTSLSTNLISISGSNATALGSGTAQIVASQAGNGNYLAATPVTNVAVIVSSPNWLWSTIPSSGSFNDAGAWTNNAAPASSTNTLLTFSNSSIASLTNNLNGYTFGGITFSSNALAYTIGGNGFTLGSAVTNANGAFILNSSTNAETFSSAITLATNAAFTNTDAAGSMVFNGGISQGANALTLSGGSFQLGGSSTYTGSGNGLNLKSGSLTIQNGAIYITTNASAYTTLGNFGGTETLNIASGGTMSNGLWLQAFSSTAVNYATNSGTLTAPNLYLMGYNTNVTGGTNQFVQASGTSTVGLTKIGGGNQGQGTGVTNRLSQSALNTLIVTGGVLNNTNFLYMGANASNSTNQLIITGGQLSAVANGIVFGPSSTTKEGATNVLNQITLGGGTLSVSKIGYSSSNAVSGVANTLTWSNGGVMQAMSNIGANFMATSTVTGNKTLAVSMGTNGGVFDVNGFTNSIGVNIADGTTNNSGSLTVINSSTNAGQLTLSGTNTFTGLGITASNSTVIVGGSASAGSTNGALNLAAGTLNIGSFNLTNSSIRIGNGLISGSGMLTAGSGGFTFTNSANQSISNVLTGAGGLVMNGAGTLTFNTNATYTGNTMVNAGTLLLNGSNAAVGTLGTNTVNSGGSLVGIGTVGTVVLNSGASLTPGVGSATGTLSVGGLTVNTGGTLNISLGGTSASQLAVNGNAVLGGTINFTAVSELTAPAYTFLSVTNGTMSGTFSQVTNLPAGYLLSYTGSSVLIIQTTNSITFPAIGSVIYSNGLSVGLTASASSGLPVSYASSSANVSISGTNATILGAGTATIVASQDGNSNYPTATPVTNMLIISKATPPSFNFASNSLSSVYTGSNVVVGVTNAGSVPVVITYNGSTNVPMGAGTYTVVATVGDTNNYTAYAVTNTLVIGKGNATISFNGTNAIYDGTAKGVVASTVPTNLSVGITYNGSTNAPTNAGSYTVVATVADANYVGSNSTTLTIGQASNAIAWTNLVTPVSYSNGLVIGLGATASSWLGVSYSSANTNLVSISGTNLAVLGAGTASIVASQAGNSNYLAATPVTNTLVIGKGSASVSITGTNAIYDGTAKSVEASTVPTNLNVGITYNGSSNAPSNAGSYTVVATVADANYAGSNTATLMIGQAANTITFPALGSRFYTNGLTIGLGATASSGLAISYSSTSTNVSISGANVTVLGAGTASIVASQYGNSNYLAATSVTNSLVISNAATPTNVPVIYEHGWTGWIRPKENR